jgi:hypothetical protein
MADPLQDKTGGSQDHSDQTGQGSPAARDPLEQDSQFDPELRESQPSSARKWGFAFALAVILALVLYGLTAHAGRDAFLQVPPQPATPLSEQAPR